MPSSIWQALLLPVSPLRVLYSIPLFHEIDFFVNEGYRKIPHGGIETAGLLFGTVSKAAIRVEAFRPIECEHAAGPSLQFSERDLAALEQQLTQSATESELADLKPIGWFLGHTRAALELSDTELKHFNRFFPEPARLALIVKPERFQPTRFGFLVRKPSREMPQDPAASAIILPLPGRTFKPGELVASIPAPASIVRKEAAPLVVQQEPAAQTKPEPKAERTATPNDTRARRRGRNQPPPAKKPEADLSTIWKVAPDEEKTIDQPAEKREDRKFARDRARAFEQAYIEPPVTPEDRIISILPPASSAPVIRPTPLPSLPNLSIIPSAYAPIVDTGDSVQRTTPHGRFVVSARSLTALAMAALLGCLVGYIAYLQLPAPVIPIDVRPMDRTIVVSWPPEETRDAVYAVIRLNDGVPVALSAQEKKNGHVALSSAKDFKVEIVARNWVRDSRGIVRYLHAINGTSDATPTISNTP